MLFFFFSSRRRHTRLQGDWSSDVCSSDLPAPPPPPPPPAAPVQRVIVKPVARLIQAGKLMAPKAIPKDVKIIKEEEMPPDVSVGVTGGVPGGVPGGQAGGVIGGIIGVFMSRAPP